MRTPRPHKTFWQRYRRYIIAGIAFFVLLIVIVPALSSESEETTSQATDQTSETEPTLTPTITSNELQALGDRLSYDELFRNNEEHIGKRVYYIGRVNQVTEPSDGKYLLRVFVTKDNFGLWEDDVRLDYEGKRLLEDDIIEFVAGVEGLWRYTTVLGAERTIPHLTAMWVIRRVAPIGTATPTPNTEPTATPELEPVPTIPTDVISVTEIGSVRLLLLEQGTTQEPIRWRVSLIVENQGSEVATIGELWLKPDRECLPEDQRILSQGMIASMFWGPWFNYSIVPSETLLQGYSERVFFRQESDIWAKEHIDEYSYHFEISPDRWISIVGYADWFLEMLGECKQLTLKVNGEEVVIPLASP